MFLIRRTVCRSISLSMLLPSLTIIIAKLVTHHNPDPNERRYTIMTMSSHQTHSSAIKTYRVEDIAKILDIGRSSAYNLVREGHFKIVRIGTAIRISRKSFDEWLESQAN